MNKITHQPGQRVTPHYPPSKNFFKAATFGGVPTNVREVDKNSPHRKRKSQMNRVTSSHFSEKLFVEFLLVDFLHGISSKNNAYELLVKQSLLKPVAHLHVKCMVTKIKKTESNSKSTKICLKLSCIFLTAEDIVVSLADGHQTSCCKRGCIAQAFGVAHGDDCIHLPVENPREDGRVCSQNVYHFQNFPWISYRLVVSTPLKICASQIDMDPTGIMRGCYHEASRPVSECHSSLVQVIIRNTATKCKGSSGKKKT